MQRTDIARDWHGKPYYSLDSYCKNTFHHKCYKIALNARMSCPIGTAPWTLGAVSSVVAAAAAILP